MENNKACCPALWFSGFFGFGAVIHILRVLLRLPLIVGTLEVRLRYSALAAGVFLLLSVWLLYVSGHKPCCKAPQSPAKT